MGLLGKLNAEADEKRKNKKEIKRNIIYFIYYYFYTLEDLKWHA
jgi:hypothetical protein